MDSQALRTNNLMMEVTRMGTKISVGKEVNMKMGDYGGVMLITTEVEWGG